MMLYVILLSKVMILPSTLSVIELSIWRELDFVIEPNLRNTVDWGRKWLVDFHAGETQLWTTQPVEQL